MNWQPPEIVAVNLPPEPRRLKRWQTMTALAVVFAVPWVWVALATYPEPPPPGPQPSRVVVKTGPHGIWVGRDGPAVSCSQQWDGQMLCWAVPR